ncbi:hypothetical protein E2562_022774 [Oryza meyeriana var. granulata]|uniref:Uncharacterized protein n=1 Tax=Oryza meyeriana var. granulata TaxID=110450 RepID=A0A6G1FBE5_9ORYZ|nr:hypothetical protein E2562_022774 [Oryza meyeriana var. granulata]
MSFCSYACMVGDRRAKRTSAQPAQSGERLRQLKEEESKRKGYKALAAGDSNLSSSASEDEESDDETTEEGGPEERYNNSSSNKKLPSYSGKKGKRSKRKRMDFDHGPSIVVRSGPGRGRRCRSPTRTCVSSDG